MARKKRSDSPMVTGESNRALRRDLGGLPLPVGLEPAQPSDPAAVQDCPVPIGQSVGAEMDSAPASRVHFNVPPVHGELDAGNHVLEILFRERGPVTDFGERNPSVLEHLGPRTGLTVHCRALFLRPDHSGFGLRHFATFLPYGLVP